MDPQQSNFYQLFPQAASLSDQLMPGGNPYFYTPPKLNYNAAYNPATQSLAPQAQGISNNLAGIMDPATLQRLRQQAFSTGPSAYAQLQSQNLSQQLQGLRGQAAGQSAGAAATAQGNLAMQGGISSGARERMGQSAYRGLFGAQQNISQQGLQQQGQISAQDIQNRMAQQQAMPGIENQYLQGEAQRQMLPLQATQTDIGNQVAEATRKNAFDLAQYQDINKFKAAQLTGLAQQNSAGKGK